MTTIYILIALLAGGAIAWIIRGYKITADLGTSPEKIPGLLQDMKQVEQELATAQNTISQQKEMICELRETEQFLRKQHIGSETQLSEARTDLRNLREKLESQKSELEAMNQRMQEQFKNLANDILEEKSKRFTTQNKEQIDQILKPLNQKISDFEKKVDNTYEKDVRDRTSLKEQIFQLTELNKKMSQDANNLVRALKGDQKTQGTWGEMILKRVLEQSGLQEGREYEVQESHSNEEGKRLQPDVVVHLPENRYLVIDAKVSLTAYERFNSAEEEADRILAMKNHLSSIKKHYQQLAQKRYQDIYENRSPDFVLMFIPVEPAFSLAMMKEPDLYQDAFSRRVVIVSPSTLLATLFTVANIWKYENQSRNAREIAAESGKLYDKFVNFVDDLQKIGTHLSRTESAWTDAMKKLNTGRGNLVSKAEKIREMGSDASKKLPETLLEQNDELTDAPEKSEA